MTLEQRSSIVFNV